MPVGPALLTGVVAGVLAACGAVVSVVQGAPDAVDVLAISTPEIAGSRNVMRTAWPPGLAVMGTLPILAARAAVRGISNPPPTAAALNVVSPLILVAALVAGWVRFHDQIHEWLRQAAEGMSPTKAMERAAAEREAAEVDNGKSSAGSKASADEEDEDRTQASSKPQAPRPKNKPKPADAPEGAQGGTSAKPIGRRRDQNQDPKT